MSSTPAASSTSPRSLLRKYGLMTSRSISVHFPCLAARTAIFSDISLLPPPKLPTMTQSSFMCTLLPA